MAAGDVMNASTRTVESDFELNQAYGSTNTEPSHERRSHNGVFIKPQLATAILDLNAKMQKRNFLKN